MKKIFDIVKLIVFLVLMKKKNYKEKEEIACFDKFDTTDENFGNDKSASPARPVLNVHLGKNEGRNIDIFRGCIGEETQGTRKNFF